MLILRGKEIAVRRGAKIRTVRNYVHTIFTKTNSDTQGEVVLKLIQAGQPVLMPDGTYFSTAA